MLKQALDMSKQLETEPVSGEPTPSTAVPDYSMMSEEEQIAFAMQLSMQPGKL